MASCPKCIEKSAAVELYCTGKGICGGIRKSNMNKRIVRSAKNMIYTKYFL